MENHILLYKDDNIHLYIKDAKHYSKLSIGNEDTCIQYTYIIADTTGKTLFKIVVGLYDPPFHTENYNNIDIDYVNSIETYLYEKNEINRFLNKLSTVNHKIIKEIIIKYIKKQLKDRELIYIY